MEFKKKNEENNLKKEIIVVIEVYSFVRWIYVKREESTNVISI